MPTQSHPCVTERPPREPSANLTMDGQTLARQPDRTHQPDRTANRTRHRALPHCTGQPGFELLRQAAPGRVHGLHTGDVLKF